MALGLGGVLSESISAQPSGEALLTSLSKGEWTIRFRGAIPERKICVRSRNGSEPVSSMTATRPASSGCVFVCFFTA